MDTLRIIKAIEKHLSPEVEDIATRISILMLKEGRLINPKDIYGIGLSVVAELIVRERLIIKTKENI